MKPEIILVEPLMPAIEAKLDDAYTVHRLSAAPDRAALLAEVGPRVRAVATGGGTGAGRDLVDALPNLGIIAINGIGTDAVDLVHAKERGIRVTTTPGVLTDDVADLAMALVLAGMRRLTQADRFVRAGRWPADRMPLARKATGKRLGILGLGGIGRAVARRAEGFGMEIAYTNRKPADGAPWRFVPDAVRLAAESDILVVAVTGGAATRNLVDRAVLDALGPEGLLVNVARGSVVDEAALVEALAEGRLGGAALDVFANEPHVPEALFAMDQVVLVPHQASATLETRTAMGELVLANLAAYFAGEPLPTPVV